METTEEETLAYFHSLDVDPVLLDNYEYRYRPSDAGNSMYTSRVTSLIDGADIFATYQIKLVKYIATGSVVVSDQGDMQARLASAKSEIADIVTRAVTAARDRGESFGIVDVTPLQHRPAGGVAFKLGTGWEMC
jgi:hypothetical protein